MAHFGVKKAKLLALAGAIAIAGAGIMSAGNASAIEDFSTLSRGTDYDCGTENSYYTITMHTTKAVKWAVKDSTKFYSPGPATCYADWEAGQDSYTPLISQIKIYIDGGEYTFDEKVTRDDGGQNPAIIIKDGSNVIFKASTDEGGLFDDSSAYRLSFNVEGDGNDDGEGGSLTFDSGTYAMSIYNEGAITFNSGNYDYMSLDNYGTVTINDGSFTADEAEGALGSHLSNQNQSAVMTIKGGNFDVANHIYPININPTYFQNAGTLNIEGGTFKYDFTNEASNSTAGADSRIGTDEKPYYGDPGALIRNGGGVVNISGGDFGGADSGKGTLINQYGSSSDTKTTISGGNFEVESMFTTLLNNDEASSPTKVEVTGGTFNTRKSFFLADYSGIPNDQCVAYDGDACMGYAGLWRDSSGIARSGFATGPNISAPYFLGATTEKGIKGGDFSDSENIGKHMPSNSDTIDLDTDYDGDGNNDVRVLEKIPNSPFSMSVEVDEQKTQNLGDPGEGSWRIYSIENGEHCTATISGNQIAITGVTPTNGDSSQFCKVTAVSDAKIAKFSVSVNKAESYFQGEPFGLSVGDTKTPDDFDGNPEDYEWIVLSGGDFCTVNDQGQVTAIKAGGVCYIGAHDPDEKKTTYWEIHTTEALDMEVGDTKKPEDLPEGAEDGEWSSDNTEVCTVADDGTITAKKAGTCHVTLILDDGSVYSWTVNIKANPDTADSMKAITFSIAGAAIAGFGAMVAVAKRFIRR